MAGPALNEIPDRAIQRFHSKRPEGAPDECWEWAGQKDKDGYGKFSYRIGTDRIFRRAHQIALILAGQPRIGDAMALHACDNPPCCNPSHLRWGTNKENCTDMKVKGRALRGEKHPLSKLTDETVRMIRSDPRGCWRLAKALGVSKKIILQVRKGRTWTHV